MDCHLAEDSSGQAICLQSEISSNTPAQLAVHWHGIPLYRPWPVPASTLRDDAQAWFAGRRGCQIAPSGHDLATHLGIFALCPQLWMWSAQQCWTWLAFDLRQSGALCLGCCWTDPAGEHWLRWQGPSGLIGSWGIIQASPSHWNCLSAAGSMCGLYIWVQKCNFSGEY